MSYTHLHRLSAALGALALATLACGGLGQDGLPTLVPTYAPPQPAATSALPAMPTLIPPTATPDQPDPVSSLQEVQKATVRIEVEGTFMDFVEGKVVDTQWGGSGFIIDPTGLAVTNNHVVTGASSINVFVDGEREARHAKIVGVSECSDLAVIDIDGGGFPFLTFLHGDVPVGTDVYAAGYPLGDPEYTLTRGIISKAKANGETSWASVNAVIEHDANLNPGNSGGPLVDAQGQVVGINYARSYLNQSYAIKGDEALGIITHLKGGDSLESIGLNGQALDLSDYGVSGILVASVRSGSPADQAGIRAGDMLLTMAGESLGQAGTMATYCNILRTHAAGSTMNLEVYRFPTSEYLAGQLNGHQLSARYSFAQNLGSGLGQADRYARYDRLQDQYSAIQLEVPAEWRDRDMGGWTDGDGKVIGSAIAAAPDLEAFGSAWSGSGVFFGVSAQYRGSDYLKWLNELKAPGSRFSKNCRYVGRQDYADSIFQGAFDVYKDCGSADTINVILTAFDPTQPDAFLVMVQVQIAREADFEALDHILNTFTVIGALP